MKRDGARPLAAPRFFVPRRCAGWSLLELSVVLAIAAVLIFFTVRGYQPKEAIALQQAERLRNDLRHVQLLAITWNQPLRVSTTANNYSIGCVSAGASPCDVDPVVNPVSGQPYLVALESGLTMAGPGFSLDLDALGRPRNAAALIAANATFTISGGTATRTVVVAPVTVFVSAQ